MKAPYFPAIHDARYVNIGDEKCICIIEEYVVGKPLSSCIQSRPQPLAFVKHVGEALLGALTHTHAANLVHRDIKPSNIMVADDGRILLIDFGIARDLSATSVTSSLALFGPMTIGYSAPEQVRNLKRQICVRTDFFALGVVLYEMAIGKNPFREGGCSDRDTLARCLEYDPLPLSSLGFPRQFSAFVEMCMQKQSHRRPPSPDVAIEMFKSIDWEGKA